MILIHKPIPLKAIIAERDGRVDTPRGIKNFKVGDYIVTAPTGCTWPITKDHVDANYDIQYNSHEETANMLESMMEVILLSTPHDHVFDDIHNRQYSVREVTDVIHKLRK